MCDLHDNSLKTVKRWVLLALSIMVSHANAAVFISEYVEGSGKNKAVEIYNNSASEVDLSTYELRMYFNGSGMPGRKIALSGILQAGGVYVVAHGLADPKILAVANLTNIGTWFNGDDAVALINDNKIVDTIGQIRFDPGRQWGNGSTTTLDHTLRRKATICTPDPIANDSFDPAVQWDSFAKDTFDGLGSHTVNCSDGQPSSTSFIHDVQGNGLVSPVTGLSVTLEAIVIGDFQGATGLSGFHIQEEDTDADTDPTTSEGIFVYDAGIGVDVKAGDLVRVSGVVKEHFELTEISAVSVKVLAHAKPLPKLSIITLPITNQLALESFEGMSVRFPQNLTVTDNYNLGHFGEVGLSSNGRLMQPTNIALPGIAANAVQVSNNLNQILLDDGSSIKNPNPIAYPPPGLSATNTLRVGDTVTNLTGVVDFANSVYKIQPTQRPNFITKNTRGAPPASISGQLKVAAFNVHNYFNGDGLGGGYPTSRGASSLLEFQRQRAKIIAAISQLDVDIIGLMEIENDGYSPTSAIQDLVNGLNASAPGGPGYTFINPGVASVGTDEIAVGIIYRGQTVKPVGNPAILDNSVNSQFNDSYNRPALAQTFTHTDSGERLTVVVNHLKSKGSNCNEIDDPDTDDGQGNCNLTRRQAAQAIVDWLATDPTVSGDSDFLIIGDLNSYAKEDPITTIKDAGYIDLIATHIGAAQAYSYVYSSQSGYLDHILATNSLAPQVAGVAIWHSNADEPRSLDYNTELKSARQIISLYKADAYRASDHDPVIVGLKFNETVKTP